jgi:phosphoglycolate phosphatase
MFHEKYGIPKEIPSDTEILSQFGKQTEEIYPSILHSTDLNVIDEFSECIETAEIQAFDEGKGKLYPKVLKILNVLKLHGYRLALCTNARIDYFEAIVRNFPLDNYFDLMFTAGQYPGKDKTWMVRRIIEKLQPQHFAVVGDRVHDFEAAKANKGIAIGCSYGFGSNEVEKADLVINAFEERDSRSLFMYSFCRRNNSLIQNGKK